MRDVYRRMADTYARVSVDNPVNAHYDRPTILGLAGDIRGKRVFELGCAAGLLTEQLADGGADVLAVDREPRLVAHATERLAGRAQVAVADLEEPFDDVLAGSVDVVVASLVLHYLEDWGPLLAELRRVLVPGGALASMSAGRSARGARTASRSAPPIRPASWVRPTFAFSSECRE